MIIRLFIEELCKTETLAFVRMTVVTVGQKITLSPTGRLRLYVCERWLNCVKRETIE